MFSLSAISLLMRPLVISTSTSISRGGKVVLVVSGAMFACPADSGLLGAGGIGLRIDAAAECSLPGSVRPDRYSTSARSTIGERFHR